MFDVQGPLDSAKMLRLHRTPKVGSPQVGILLRSSLPTPPLPRDSSGLTEANLSTSQSSEFLKRAQPSVRTQTSTPPSTPSYISDKEVANFLLNLSKAAPETPGLVEHIECVDGGRALFNLANSRLASNVRSPSEDSSDEEEPTRGIICHGNYYHSTTISKDNAIWGLLGREDPSKPATEYGLRSRLEDHNGELQCPRCSLREANPLGHKGNLITRIAPRDKREETEPLCADAKDDLELKRGGAAKYNDTHYELGPPPSVKELGNHRLYLRKPVEEALNETSDDETEDEEESEYNELIVPIEASTPTSQSFPQPLLEPAIGTLQPIKPPLAQQEVRRRLGAAVAAFTPSRSKRIGRTAFTTGLGTHSAYNERLVLSSAASPVAVRPQAKNSPAQTAAPTSSGKNGKAPARVATANLTSTQFATPTSSKTKSSATAPTTLPAPQPPTTSSKRKTVTFDLTASELPLATPTPAPKKRRLHAPSPLSITTSAPPAAERRPAQTFEELFGPKIAAGKAKAEAVVAEEEEKRTVNMEAEQRGARKPSQRTRAKSAKLVEAEECV